ncbi:hypothetical protein [Streptomyces sp. URMC 123]|uniref:hypothetical protein n=1 Tax=Streptomyces sp. URMC 123 TaxID=3423403 RepID=UPI003F1BC428
MSDQDEYTGPAVLVSEDGTELDVSVEVRWMPEPDPDPRGYWEATVLVKDHPPLPNAPGEPLGTLRWEGGEFRCALVGEVHRDADGLTFHARQELPPA